MTGARFCGWPTAALDFFRSLEQDNTRAFWTAHKDVYEGDVRAPFDALSELVLEEFGPLRVLRPYRDVRFSKDKSPYKTRAYASTRGKAASPITSRCRPRGWWSPRGIG